MTNELSQKKIEYVCEMCDYKTCSKKDYAKHEATAKHIRMVRDEEKLQKIPNLVCGCGKNYKHASSLWNHRQKCSGVPSFIQAPILEKDAVYEALLKILRDNPEVFNRPVEQQVNNTVNNNTVNANNNLTINMFLEKYCKDAVSIHDFIDSIDPTRDDIFYLTKHGNKEGVTRILNTAFDKMAVTERPIHCTDIKRQTTYVKEPEGWNKEVDRKSIKKLYNNVQHKCLRKAVEILDTNPNYKVNGTPEYEERIKMIAEVTSDSHQESILRNLVESVHINKDSRQITM